MYYQNNLLDDLKPLSGLRGKTFQMTSALLLSMFPSQSNDWLHEMVISTLTDPATI